MDIIVIHKNKSALNFNIPFRNIDDIKSNIYCDINEVINNNINFQKLKDNLNETFLAAITEHLDINDMIMTFNIYYTENYVYQLVFVEGNNNNYLNDDLNYLATQLTNGMICLNTALIVKNKILDDNTTEFVSITKDDIKDIIHNKIIKKGVIVDSDNNVSEFEYINSPLEKYSFDTSKKTYRYLEIKLYNCSLEVYYKIDEFSSNLNTIGSLICNKRIYDTIVMALSYIDTDNNCIYHITTDKSLFEKIIKLSQIDGYEPSYTSYEKYKFCNIYRCINSEYDKYKDQDNKMKEIEALCNNAIVNKIV